MEDIGRSVLSELGASDDFRQSISQLSDVLGDELIDENVLANLPFVERCRRIVR